MGRLQPQPRIIAKTRRRARQHPLALAERLLRAVKVLSIALRFEDQLPAINATVEPPQRRTRREQLFEQACRYGKLRARLGEAVARGPSPPERMMHCRQLRRVLNGERLVGGQRVQERYGAR